VIVEKHGFDELAADLERAGADITKQVAKVTGMACNQMKKDVRKTWTGIPHLPHLPRAVTYDVTTSGTKVTGELGADHEKPQGKLAWVAEYGTPTSAPRPAFRPAADKEVPVWIGFLEKVAVDAIGEGR
jgi:hypothetical protein